MITEPAYEGMSFILTELPPDKYSIKFLDPEDYYIDTIYYYPKEGTGRHIAKDYHSYGFNFIRVPYIELISVPRVYSCGKIRFTNSSGEFYDIPYVNYKTPIVLPSFGSGLHKYFTV